MRQFIFGFVSSGIISAICVDVAFASQPARRLALLGMVFLAGIAAEMFMRKWESE